MAFLSNLFSRTPKEPLPTWEALAEARNLPLDLPGLAALMPDFDHLATAAEREAWAEAVKTLHKGGQGMPEPWLEALDRLLPELIPAWQGEREGCFHRPVAEGLSQRFRVGDRVVQPADLVLWHVDREEVLERAHEHLRARTEAAKFERLPSGAYRSAHGDGLDAARLLLPEFWGDLFPGQNTFVTVPRADAMFLAPQVLLPKLVDATRASLQEDGAPRLLGVLYQRVERQLVPASLQDPHPMAQAQRELRQSDLLEALGTQAQDLDAALGMPAPVFLVSTGQGRTMTVATWVEGAPVLLPETDLVAFVGAGGPLGIFHRQTLPRMHELKGTPVEIWGPRRARYEGFPSAEQLARLECFANADQMAALAQPKGGRPAPQGAQAAPAPAAPQARPAHLRGVNLGTQDAD